MAGNIRIRKLARRLGRRNDEVLAALSALGHPRYSSPDDALSPELAGRVEEAMRRARAAPAPAPASEESFDDVMRSHGVQKLGARRPRGAGPPASKPRVAPAPQLQALSRPARQPRRPVPVPRPAPAPRPAPRAPSRSATAELLDRIESLQDRVQSLEAELGRERRRTADTGADTDRARTALVTLFGHLEDRDRVIDTLRRQLAEVGPPDERETPLGAELEARGLKGRDEHAGAVRALLDARRWPDLAASLAVARPRVLQAMLRERLVLQCGRPRCAVPRFTVPVRVPPSRCEICAGEDLPNTMRRLSDELLLSGANRILILGGGPGEHRLLAEKLDERVSLIGISGRAPVVPGEALESAGVVILWTGAEPDLALVESLERAMEGRVEGARISRRPERGLGEMALALIRDLSDRE